MMYYFDGLLQYFDKIFSLVDSGCIVVVSNAGYVEQRYSRSSEKTFYCSKS